MATILIADDSPVTQRLIGLTLRRAGHTTCTADDGLAALDQLQAARPDLLIADLLMPELDGLSLLRRLRANPLHEHLPVLMLTASSEAADGASAVAAGADAYLTKPASSSELLAVVGRLLERTP
jgi:two-component system chemotaxis response regulator CheY